MKDFGITGNLTAAQGLAFNAMQQRWEVAIRAAANASDLAASERSAMAAAAATSAEFTQFARGLLITDAQVLEAQANMQSVGDAVHKAVTEAMDGLPVSALREAAKDETLLRALLGERDAMIRLAVKGTAGNFTGWFEKHLNKLLAGVPRLVRHSPESPPSLRRTPLP